MKLISHFEKDTREKILVAQTFVLDLVSRCSQDKITVIAGHLAYVSLLSLVPFIMVFFSILQAFPPFAEVRVDLEMFIFNNFVPHAGDVVQKYMTEFVGNASQMGAISIFSLVVVALLLISNIDKTLNQIWRIKSERPAIYTFAVYWMVLTLGPLLIGSSVLLSSYLVGIANYADEYTQGATEVLIKIGTFVASISAFFIVYMVVPNRRINPKHALAGAVLASVLFELTKLGFALYVASFPSYQLIYGALAVIPILFVWVYLSWMVVLIGAEFTHELEIFLSSRQKAKLAEMEELEEKAKRGNDEAA